MSSSFRDFIISKRGIAIVVSCAVAVILGISLLFAIIARTNRNNALEFGEGDNLQLVSQEPLFGANGWNASVVEKLSHNLNQFGDNLALGNGGGLIVSSVVTFGGMEWTVVFKQKNMITLLANRSVATMPYDEVADYLNGEFYSEFKKKVGYANLDDLIVPYGDRKIYYQVQNAQSVLLEDLTGHDIRANDGKAGAKFWIPSAYEIGGFAVTNKSPTARVNSFKTTTTDYNRIINTGLWNTSNSMRKSAGNVWLRSTVGGETAGIINGVVKANSEAIGVRPCVNIALPNTVVSDSASTEVATAPKLANPDYTNAWTVDGSGRYQISTVDDLIRLSDAVADGVTFDSKTFILMNDLDFSNCTVWLPIGYMTEHSSMSFRGVLNGNGFKIKNLGSANTGLVGLFGYMRSGGVNNLGICDSFWWTTADNVGALIGYAYNPLVEKCYSTCGVSGGNYVGGLVGKFYTNTTAARMVNCYNAGSVSGNDYVGGLVGGKDTTSTQNLNITYSYNKAPVSAIGSHVDGVGTGMTYTASQVFSYSAAANGVTKTYDFMRTQSNFSGYDFTNTWYMPKSINDRMPALRAFIKTVSVEAYSYIESTGFVNETVDNTCSVQLNNGNPTNALAKNASCSIKAMAKVNTNAHYRLKGWYYAETSENYLPINWVALSWSPTVAVSSGIATYSTTQGFAEDMVLVAVFERLFCYRGYDLGVGFENSGDYVSGLTVTYVDANNNPATGYDATGQVSNIAANNIWYPEGTMMTLTMVYPTNSTALQAHYETTYTGSPSSANTIAVTRTTNNGVVTETFTSALHDVSRITATNTTLPSGDSIYIYFGTIRQYRIDLAAKFTSDYSAIDSSIYDTIQLSVKGNGWSSASTYNSSTDTSDKSLYSCRSDVYYDLSVSTYTSTKLNFVEWAIIYTDSTTHKITLNTQTTNRSYIQNLAIPSAIANIKLYALFTPNMGSVTITEGDNDAQDAYGKVVVSTNGSLTDISSLTETPQLQNVPVGSTVYVYLLPDYANFYVKDSSKGLTGFSSVGSNGLCKKAITIESSVAQSYKVYYKQRTDLAVNFTLDVSKVPTEDRSYITAPTNLTNKSKTDTIGSSKLAINKNYKDSYFVYSIDKVKLNNTTYNLASSQPGAVAGTLNGNNQEYTLSSYFSSSVPTIGAMLALGGEAITYTNTTLTIKLTIYPVNFTVTSNITVDDVANQTVAGLVTITSKVGNSDPVTVTNGQCQYESIVTVTCGKTGYQIGSVTLSGGTTTFDVQAVSGSYTYGGTVTGKFTMPSTSVVVNISIYSKSYQLAVVDNLNSSSYLTEFNASSSVPEANKVSSLNASDKGLTTTQNFSVTKTRTNPGLPSDNANSEYLYYGSQATIGGASVSIKFGNNNLYESRLVAIKVYAVKYTPTKGFNGSPSYTLISSHVASTGLVFTPVDTFFTPTDHTYDYFNGILVIFEYKLLQKVSLTFDLNGSGIEQNLLLAILARKENGIIVEQLVVFVAAGNENAVTIMCESGEYEVINNLGIFATVEVTQNGDDVDETINITDDEATEIIMTATGTPGSSATVFVVKLIG